MATLYRSDQSRIQVQVAGVQMDSVSWDVMDGGDITAESVNYLPGGMAPAVELGGIPKRGDLTVARIWSDAMIAVYKALDDVSGRAACTVTYVVLDANGNTVPNATFTYTGVLKSVNRPNYDSSTSSEAKIQLVIGCNRSIN
jgi:hypothetical protein